MFRDNRLPDRDDIRLSVFFLIVAPGIQETYRVSPLRRAPVTAECLIVCTALFVICYAQTFDGTRFRDAQRQWGAAAQMQIISLRDDPPEPIHRQLNGPFDVWNGEWWRIPLGAFHHADALHLLFNCLSGWYLGRRLENRWGAWRYLLFLIPAIVIPMLVQAIVDDCAVGISGAICAMLGALMVVQEIDPREDDVSDDVIQLSLGMLLLGIPATMLHLLPVANTAHIAGLVYGWLAAWSTCGRHATGLTRCLFIAAHLLVIPGFWLAVHPVNNGRYLWYIADHDHRIMPQQRETLLKLAIESDPSLTGIWLRLADYRVIEGNLPEAWVLLIEGLSRNPDDADLFEATRRLWRRLSTEPEREAAEAELQRVFGDSASIWSEQIRATGLALVKRKVAPVIKAPEQELNPKDFPLDRPMDLEWKPRPPALQSQPPVDPEKPDSAIEGTTL